MQSEVMFAGFGGQGILLIGKILAHTAMEEGHEVAWIPSYGPEMRGGTAYCTVVISDRPIGSPIIRNPLHLVAMNRPSLEKFAPMVKPGGVIFINSSLIDIKSDRNDVDELVRTSGRYCQINRECPGRQYCRPSVLCGTLQVVDLDQLRECVKEEFAQIRKN